MNGNVLTRKLLSNKCIKMIKKLKAFYTVSKNSHIIYYNFTAVTQTIVTMVFCQRLLLQW